MLREESVDVGATWCGVEDDAGSDAKHSRSVKRDAEQHDKYEQLHRRLKRIVKARGALDAQEAEALREAERLWLWRHFGYGSLLEYMEMEMGYTPRAALERLRVAKALVELPAIADAMAQGDLSFSAGRELTRVATPGTEQEWLEATGDKNLRDVEHMVSGHKRGDKPSDPADPKLRTRNLRYEGIDDETVALLREARQILERECGDRMSDREFLRVFARMVIDGVGSPERTRAPYQIAVTTCDQCKRGWQDGGGITAEMSPATLETALCDAQHIGRIDDLAAQTGGGLDDVAAQTGGGLDDVPAEPGADSHRMTANRRAQSKAPASKTKGTRSAIPPTTRRKVRHRDHGRCRVPWCRSSRNCDAHHMRPLALGGGHNEENLITLCESHHLAHHAGALIIEGTASNPVFKRRAHNAFALAERAVDAARALKELGFDRHEVKAALERTRTHVGTAELTLEHWIKIALSYCPKPRA